MSLKRGNSDVSAVYVGSTTINKIYRGSTEIYSATAIDPDAQAFITAAGITDGTQQSAINTLVLSMKTAGVWTKCVAVYPFVGGTADSHKYNLKDPRDLDAAYRLTYNGAYTHDAMGVKQTTRDDASFMDTKLAYQTAGLTTAHLLVSVNQSNTNYGYDIGSAGGSASDWALISKYQTGAYFFKAGAGSYLTAANADTSLGVWSGRADGTTAYLDKNAVNVLSGARTVDGSTNSLYISNVNGGGYGSQGSDRRYDFASLGTFLTDIELTDYYNAIETFNTTLSR